MKLKIFSALLMGLLLMSCSGDMAKKIAKSEYDKMVIQKDKEIAALRIELEALQEQFKVQQELSARDSNKRRNENIRSLFAREKN